jgi:hypothetical protein
MARMHPDVHSFVGGLLSPKLEGRVDYSKYGVGCRVLENFIATPTGGIYKRPGLRFVAKAKQNNVRLVPFDFNGSERQSYILEIGDGYIRFFTRGGQLVGGDGKPLELPVSALTGMDLTKLSYVQSADVIYFAHPQMQPWRLERLSATNWAYQGMSFRTQSAWPLPFEPGNYPSKVRIYEDRLIYAATPKQPVNIWMSRLSDFTDFRINSNSDQSKEPLAEDAIFLRLQGSRVNPIQWILDMEQLVVGTNASEIRIQGRDLDAPLTPQTAGHKRQSSYGSNEVQAILLGSSAMFCSRTGTGVYTLDYQDFGYRFKSAPLNILCPEATQPSVVEMHSMQEPEPIAWCILADGTFSGCTYIRDQQIFAWHRHSTQGKVKSGAIIPYVEGDQFWMAVERSGQTFIEYLETPFDYNSEDATFSVFMDAMLSGTTENAGEIRGLTFLADKKAQVMADGSYLGELAVQQDGSIRDPKIPKNAYVVAGLGYTAEVQTMRINYAIPSRTGAGGQAVNFKKRILALTLRCLGSIKGEARAEYEQGAGEWQKILSFPHSAVSGVPPQCRSENIPIPIAGNSDYGGLIRVRQPDPFPFFLVSIAYTIDQGLGG